MTGGIFSTMQMRILSALVLLMVMIAAGSYASLNYAKINFLNPNPAMISVEGNGEIFAVPDIGQFSFSVMAEADDATTAQELSGTKINAILAYLKEQGIEDKDIKVQNYNLYPRWRYEERVCPANSYCPPGERVQDGFEVSQTISVKVRDTKAAPALISGVGERGATDISNLSFTIDDEESLKAEARAAAIKDAQEKAGLLAEQLGVRVVRLVSFNENGYYQPYAQTKIMAMDMAEEAVGFGGAELPVGEESVTVQVNITYEVK